MFRAVFDAIAAELAAAGFALTSTR
jgi:hypothetical protein